MIRQLLRLLPRRMVVSVLSGPLRGARWVVGSSVHSCWLGSYERETQRVFREHIRPGMTVLDAGANAGFFSLLAARLVGPTGHVIAFEPFDETALRLRRHVALNHFTDRVTVEPIALSDHSGMAMLHVGHLSSASLFPMDSGLNPFWVRTVRLDEWRERAKLPHVDFIKMDIEGAEGAAIQGMKEVIREDHPTCYIALHGGPYQSEILNVFMDAGYHVTVCDNILLALPLQHRHTNYELIEPRSKVRQGLG